MQKVVEFNGLSVKYVWFDKYDNRFQIWFQNLVGSFVDHQNQAYAKIRALEEEIESHKKHILTLKRELNDAVRREYEEEVTWPLTYLHILYFLSSFNEVGAVVIVW